MVALVRVIFIGVAEVKPDEMNLRDNGKNAGIDNFFNKFCRKGKNINEAVTGGMEIYSHLKSKKSK